MHSSYRMLAAYVPNFAVLLVQRNECRLLLASSARHSVLGSTSSASKQQSYSQRYYSESTATTRRYIPRRTMMYVPGHDFKKLRKIPDLGVDCAVLECEDGVALNKKAEARDNVRRMLDELGDVEGVDMAVRVNGVDSGQLKEDLQVIMTAQRLPQTILLPKSDRPDQINTFHDQLKSALGSRATNYKPRLITYVESAEGLLNMVDILKTAQEVSKNGVFQIDGVVFGSDDFIADIGARRTPDAKELTYARLKTLTVAKAFRIQAIDMVFIDYKDTDGLRKQALEGACAGFTGKQIIHPSQVTVVRDAFTPSTEMVDWATQLVTAFDQHQISGQGAFTFRGHMVDRPLLLQARNVLQTINNVTK